MIKETETDYSYVFVILGCVFALACAGLLTVQVYALAAMSALTSLGAFMQSAAWAVIYELRSRKVPEVTDEQH